MADQLADPVAAWRAEPAPDVTSDRVAARDAEGGGGLSEEELLDSLLLIIGAGTQRPSTFSTTRGARSEPPLRYAVADFTASDVRLR
ncbi:hypothetical protein [Streptomyces sp. 8N616]|uniref:hypothetical protein n=1 Tax=Streptomyces sp. 8N616 TaxID=3457414 RepID=UPI003FD58F8B